MKKLKEFTNYLKTNPFIGPLFMVSLFVFMVMGWKYLGPDLYLYTNVWLILAVGIPVYFYFVTLAFENIDKLNRKKLTLMQSTMSIIFSVLWAIIFFGILYAVVYMAVPNSFEGPIGKGFASQLISFQYFSFMTFSLGSYGEIFPVHNLARLAVIFQVIYHFIIFIFIVGQFTSIRKLLKKKSFFG